MDREEDSIPAPRGDRSAIALLAGFLLLIGAVVATILLTARQQEAFVRVRHTLEVENQVSLVLSRLQDAETGERGYLLARGNHEFLEPYRAAVAHSRGDLDRLAQLVDDSPAQTARVRELTRIALVREDLLASAIARFDRGEALPPDHFLRGKALMDQLRSIVLAIKADEDGLLAARTATADRYAAFVVI